ncbi:hypothetical protein [Aquimarina rubra]|uniref:hypothetical protein n=1 Tax=Aquimarina rubra TaxID=1920033 RepID=UPI00367135F2
MNTDSVTVVVFKNSKQLKRKKIQKNNFINLKTFDLFDAIALNANYFHQVDGIEVWNGNLPGEAYLHFTDGMGNGYLENEEELEY